MADPDLDEKIIIGFIGDRFEISAEGCNGEVSQGGYLFERDVFPEMRQCIIVNFIQLQCFDLIGSVKCIGRGDRMVFVGGSQDR